MIAQRPQKTRSLLSGNTEGLTASTGGLGSLSSNLVSPVMSETSMVLGLSHSLKILSHHGIEIVGDKLGPATVLWVLLSVEEPVWHTVLSWVLHNGDELLDFIFSQLTGTLVEVNLSHLAAQVGESTSTTLDLSECEHNLPLTGKIGVHHTQHVLERFRHHKGLWLGGKGGGGG